MVGSSSLCYDVMLWVDAVAMQHPRALGPGRAPMVRKRVKPNSRSIEHGGIDVKLELDWGTVDVRR